MPHVTHTTIEHDRKEEQQERGNAENRVTHTRTTRSFHTHVPTTPLDASQGTYFRSRLLGLTVTVT